MEVVISAREEKEEKRGKREKKGESNNEKRGTSKYAFVDGVQRGKWRVNSAQKEGQFPFACCYDDPSCSTPNIMVNGK